MKGTNIDLLHVLFGSVLALDDQTLLLIAGNATVTLIVLALIYRPLVIECVDPGFLRSVSRAGAPAHLAFLALVVINLVCGFHALGTLLAVGIMMLPAAIGRFWARDITPMIVIAAAARHVSGYRRALAVVPPRRRAVGPGDHSGRRRALCRCRCCSAVSAGWCRAAASPDAISKPDRTDATRMRSDPMLSQRLAIRCRCTDCACGADGSDARMVAAGGNGRLKVVATFSILAIS